MTSYTSSGLAHYAPVYLALDTISLNRHLRSPELGRPAVTTLTEALALPSIGDLGDLGGIDRRRIALRVHIADVYGGCHIVRSSYLLSLLGFGNARLKLHVRLHDLDSGLRLSSFTHFLRHSGLNRGAEDYLEDNSAALVKELSLRAAHDLTTRARKRLRPPLPVSKLVNRFRHQFGSNRYAYDKRNNPS